MLELALISLIGCSVGATRDCNADALSVAAQLQETALEVPLSTVPDRLSEKKHGA
jgi:hypothetical protein